jgi:hypothetical protein
MEKSRLIRTAALAVAFAAFLGFAATLEPPRIDIPETMSLKDLAEAAYDFRGCDGGHEHVADFWTAEVTGLYTMTSADVDVRANDRGGCHVNDFWTENVAGLYTMATAAVTGSDPAIKLIELSVASADAEDDLCEFWIRLSDLYRLTGASELFPPGNQPGGK